MSAILRSRVARQVLTSTRGFASVPEVMVRERTPRDLDARCRPTDVERINSLFLLWTTARDRLGPIPAPHRLGCHR
jgi:hypothetical protein